MQEVFEKIDAVLQKYRKKWLEQPATEPCKGFECKGIDCMDCILNYLENDINQVAEEYNNEFCEWHKVKNGNAYKCNTHAEIHDSRVLDWYVCPYCGKKIKVVEQ